MLLAADPGLEPIGYSYWRVLAHDGGKLRVFLRLGEIFTLVTVDKATEALSLRVLPIKTTAEQCYWSTGKPNEIYVPAWSALKRYNVDTGAWTTVFDLSYWSGVAGANTYLWQCSSSADDMVHACTIRDSESYARVGCFVYFEGKKSAYFKAEGALDECQADKSGKWLVIKEDENNKVIDLETGDVRVILDRDGAAGHSDLGYGQMLGHSNQDNGWWLWDLETLTKRLVYQIPTWERFVPSHVSWCCAPLPFVVGYGAGSDEAMVIRLDGGAAVPFSTPGIIHGSVDLTGEWFIYSNANKEARLVRVPQPGFVERRSGKDRRISTSSGPNCRALTEHERNI